MILTQILLLILVTAGAGLILRARAGPASIIVLQTVTSVSGLATLSTQGVIGWDLVVAYGGGLVALLVARLIVVARRRDPALARRITTDPLPERVVWAIVLTAGVLAMYHLAVGGIALFSDHVERQRFDFTSSGLFGIPGRMFLFGVDLAWVLATVNAAARGTRWRSSRPWVTATAVLLVTTLLSGFKGQFLSVVVLAALTWSLLSSKAPRIGTLARRFWILVVAGVAYLFATALLYPSYNDGSDTVVGKLLARFTTVSAEPRALAMTRSVGPLPENLFVNDIKYYLERYFNIPGDASFSFERMVSAAITGVDPASAAWTTPVTVGGFAEFSYAWGVGVAVCGFFALGLVLGRIEASKPRTVINVVVNITLVLAIQSFIAKGGAIYNILNWAAVAVMLAGVGAVVGLLGRGTASSSLAVSEKGQVASVR
ncbi:hypothetical protein [Cellulomonas phragmiteti]|uniref:Oligosaccharide repeat unit polymerase n=1 Tax=Cellulomonas phragmiteti TaxID=478780 RepID=A0ABQ4DIG5_9CELL|nr:hypothetical protein [Cellulomonas phragmiteti]GIG38797.1 hypothetical protein Cph01nite_05590 [Cellulomonas phragmiteti]